MKLFRRSIDKEKGEREGNRKAARTTLGVFVVLGVLVLSATVIAQPPTPSFIRGWVNCNTGDPINNPNVTITNLNTSEAFIAETAASSNYYQALTSSLNVSTGNVLNFNGSNNGNSTEFNYTVTHADMCAGGFEQNITIECGQQQGMCGDVDGSEMVDMADYFLLVDYIAEIPGRTLESEWAGDVDCSDKVDMADYFLLVDYIAEIPGRDLDCC
ncbi:hypothetical protein C5S39_14650 [Candidatus Methanophagaceae archaeon]|nr:hypothetical protein C5S39_14650 [Methanophagales archaeon]